MIFPPSCYGTAKAIEKFILELHLHVILYFLPATVQDNDKQYGYMTAETMCLSALCCFKGLQIQYILNKQT